MHKQALLDYLREVMERRDHLETVPPGVRGVKWHEMHAMVIRDERSCLLNLLSALCNDP